MKTAIQRPMQFLFGRYHAAWKIIERQARKGWPASRFLAVIAEHEIAERGRRRIEPPSRRGAAGQTRLLGDSTRTRPPWQRIDGNRLGLSKNCVQHERSSI